MDAWILLTPQRALPCICWTAYMYAAGDDSSVVAMAAGAWLETFRSLLRRCNCRPGRVDVEVLAELELTTWLKHTTLK